LLIVAAGGFLPIAYELFRMGYYGLLFPGTALAKDASGNKWAQGWVYLVNFDEPYLLWLPALLLGVLALPILASRGKPWWIRRGAPSGYSSIARMVQSPAAVVLFILVSGLLQACYWIRQGGDFMHGRVLLTPMFCLLAPVAVIPVLVPDGTKFSRGTGYQLAAVTSMLWLAVVGWSLWAANAGGMGSDATRVTYTGIVDERRFYSQATGNAHPLTAADYLDYPRRCARRWWRSTTLPTERCCSRQETTTSGTSFLRSRCRRTDHRKWWTTTTHLTRCSSPISACWE
jgi:arabinofuranosyltransferase